MPGVLKSMGSQRVIHDLATEQQKIKNYNKILLIPGHKFLGKLQQHPHINVREELH